MKPKALAIALLLGTLMLPALASARQGQGQGNGPASGQGVGEGAAHVITSVRFLTRYLGLSSSQATQVQGFLQTLQTSLQSVQTSRAALCQQLRTDVTAATPNPTTVGTDYLALIANQAKVQAAITAFETSVEGILTSTQLTKFQALVQAAGTITGNDTLPGCPPADDSSSDS
ncbi:MAG TPA: hypothetical protein VGP73_20870 [Thermoanaerobaculia bacterium]